MKSDELMDMGYSASIIAKMVRDPVKPAKFFASARNTKAVVKGADILALTRKYMTRVYPTAQRCRSRKEMARRKEVRKALSANPA